jgi:uncharacterized heparinase superfamily protein
MVSDVRRPAAADVYSADMMNAARTAMLYFHTARQLSPSQLFYWPLRRLQGAVGTRRRDVHANVNRGAVSRIAERLVAWEDPRDAFRVARADEVLDGAFRFLNHSERLQRIDWNRRLVSHLWTYNLHYFDYAVDLAFASVQTGDPRYAAEFLRLARSWIADTRPGKGDGWDPYVISVRVVNWVYALALLRDLAPTEVGDVWSSLASQLDTLDRRLERHLGANHLLRNYRALLIGGLSLDGHAAQRWRRTGRRGIEDEVRRQVLADGGHYERSPMYHASVLTDCLESLDIARTCEAPLSEEFNRRVGQMVSAFGILSRSDGDLHLFNDSANGVASDVAQIHRLAMTCLGIGVPSPQGACVLPTTGYFGFVDDAVGERIVVDCGAPGPAEQPGHAHCDMLSFELDLSGRRVIVDSGTAGYAGESLRGHQRSTSAHNTVMIGDREQSEIWSTFRVARRARAEFARIDADADSWMFVGACRPYHSDALHRRTIQRLRPGAWRVTDVVDGARGLPLRSFLHFHPDYHLTIQGEELVARAPGHCIRVDLVGIDHVRVAIGENSPNLGWYSPKFGVRLPAPTAVMTVSANDGRSFGFIMQDARG